MSELIPSDAVKAILNGAAVELITVDGNTFTSREVFLPPKDPMPGTLQVHTLQGIVDFIGKFNKAAIEYIHVKNATEVYVIGALEGRHRARPYYLQATPVAGKKFSFNAFHDQEVFVIGVQVAFVPTEQRAKLLSIVGNLLNETVINQDDDGVTQKVITRRGVSMANKPESAPNPITLSPYRTFPEIPQPSSPFILRIKEGCQVALFETADHQWELQAIQAIADYLTEKIEGVAIIA